MPDDSTYAPFSIARRDDGTVIELGRGAMGITYQATDTQLGRTVALKVINATYLGDPGARQRFLGEARAAAQLQHANIASIYHLRTEGGEIFYAMEFVDGETVEAFVKRRGPLPTRLAARIIQQAAQGLAAANERGLIHRDIKPANLMLARSPGQTGESHELEEEDGLLVKVIDFGLAKSISSNESAGGLTGGNVVGTPYFMSPEQISVEGGGKLDCRSDIYSLGITFWYLLTGRAPFEGSQFQILSQHLQKQPPLEELTAAAVAPEIVSLIGSMLAKDREDRPANYSVLISALKKFLRVGGQSTRMVSSGSASEHPADGTTLLPASFLPVPAAAPQLRAPIAWWKVAMPVGLIALALGLAWWRPWSGTRRSPGDETTSKSVAVLPFVNMSADKNDEYLSDGMTEELLNLLAKVKGLRVPGRTSSFAFKGRTEDGIFRKVGEELRVTTVLEGSVRKAGDKLRITAQLINVADGYHVWSETYDADMKDILAVQSDVAQRVVRALQVQLGVEEARALAKTPTQNPEAYRLYLLGRYHFAKFTRAGWTNAIRYFEQALQVDPNFVLAYCGLADTYGWCGGQVLAGKEAWAREKNLALKALSLDPNLADAHLSLGIALFSMLDLAGSERELSRALELNPGLALAHDQFAWTLMARGRFDDVIKSENRALELDPLNPLFHTDLGLFLQLARRYDEGIVQLRKTLEMDSNNALAHLELGWCYLWKGNFAAALPEFELAAKLDGLPWYVGSLGYAYAVTGDRAKAEQCLRQLDEMAKSQYVSPAARASVYLGLGDKTKALDWLELAFADEDPITWWQGADQLYDSVRNEPRYQALVKNAAFKR